MFVSNNEQETIKLGLEFALQLKLGDIVLLEGDLGAGKTTFTKGIARGLAINEPITSPTFTIANEYLIDGGIFVHIDAYRLQSVDVREIGLYDIIGAKNKICIIEWSQYLDLLKNDFLKVEIKYIKENTRQIIISKG